MLRIVFFTFLVGSLFLNALNAQDQPTQSVDRVNVFLGSSGDHGQLSPAASYPFSAISIAPQTYPTTHTGYEYLAKEVLGFTHNRFEGVGCQGSGGVLLVKPFLGKEDDGKPLMKINDQAKPGFYAIRFANEIEAKVTVNEQTGVHYYTFPKGEKGIRISLDHAFNNAFVDEQHHIDSNTITGWVTAKTTCHVGVYKMFYCIKIDQPVGWVPDGEHGLTVNLPDDIEQVQLTVGTSAVDEKYAVASAQQGYDEATMASESAGAWQSLLDQIEVNGDEQRAQLFYSLLYRALQSPYLISEADGAFRAVDGNLYKSESNRYHGWAIWDNYKTQLPLLSLVYPQVYGNIVSSIADLYPYGKNDFAGPTEPANSVRTEHAVVVLLDALKKGFAVDFPAIKDSLIAESQRLDHSKPDRALESAYDLWALAEFFKLNGDSISAKEYYRQAANYSDRWKEDFSDLTKNDVDRMSARGMYQGTIRQYRWAVPFDVEGLVKLAGGETAFTQQLDDFFDGHYFNRANEPDLQAQMLYYASSKPWKYQQLVHQLAVDTVIQHYFNDNSRGIGSHIDRIYKNEPKAFIRTMDDDAGAMSSWFVLTAIGLHPACVGHPIYYLNVPLFESITIKGTKKPLHITVENFGSDRPYIQEVTLNGKSIDRLWLTHDELSAGGTLIITAADKPIDYGADNKWITHF